MTAVAAAVACPVCRNALPTETWNLSYETYCPSCRTPITAVVFPALFRPAEGAPAELAVEGAEATCFYHATKKAAAACDHCGRFLCSLCHVEMLGQNWCPNCLEAHRAQAKVAALENRRTLYDDIALMLAFGSFLFWPVMIVTAPATLFVVARYWRKPLSITPRTRVRFVIAGVVALLEIAGWAALIAVLFHVRTR